MKTQSKTIGFDLDRIKNLVFTMQLCLAMLAFPVLFIVQLTHKYQDEQSTETSNQVIDNSSNTISYNK